MQLFINIKKPKPPNQRVVLCCGDHGGKKINKTTLQQKSKHGKVDHNSQHSAQQRISVRALLHL